MRRRSSFIIVVLCILTNVAPQSRSATDAVDIRTHTHFQLAGSDEARLRSYLDTADVNGDGSIDLVVSDCLADSRNGRTSVFFGPFGDETVSSDEVPGFQITGSEDSGACNVGIGDMNGDGRSDVIVGAPRANNLARGKSGSTYVVFGKGDERDVDLGLFDMGLNTTEGYRIDGPHDFALAGQRVHGVSDLNSDGRDEILVGAPFAGSAYVVFGKSDALPIDLSTFNSGTQGPAGFRIQHRVPNLNFNYQVAALGDVNSDGLEDVAVAMIRRNRHPGNVWVVFGKSNNEPVRVNELGEHGFKIKGASEYATTGLGLSEIGDMNGDGFDDIAVGAPAYWGVAEARTYIVLGRGSVEPVRLQALGDDGFVIRGEGASRQGISVTGVGDVDGDGLPDVVVGAPEASNNGRERSGSGYLIHGKDDNDPVRLRRLDGKGTRFDGAHGASPSFPDYGDLFGAIAAPAGDLDDDGLNDFFIGAPAEGDLNLGRIYLILSSDIPGR